MSGELSKFHNIIENKLASHILYVYWIFSS